MPLQVANDRILVRVTKRTAATHGFTHAADKTAKIDYGEVVAVGPGRFSDKGERIPMSTKAGDKIHFFRPFDGPAELIVEGEKLLIINDSHVVAIE